MDCVALMEQLASFASNFKHLKQGLLEDNSDEEESNETNESNVSDVDSELFKGHVAEKSVKKIACKLLHQYRLCSAAYENLDTVYKFLITVGTTQCTCKRVLSRLKIIKTRLRSSITQKTWSH